ncbi:MAG: protein kinase [Pirellulaceae bacterium]|nr:protein kinase [Pirellulaceae bacterium]
MSTPSVIRAGFEPIPGYILRQRLGAGGYGEVWSADAPGGLKKAVKLVYGTLDEQRASSELRSLQRIRQVHHPLLLSLERIEIVNGQLIIVTELAESSLMDCYHAARRRQMQGVPRDQLLDFLRDAADALDYLSQKHDLQHLDVKPGNLLIMADRIKVADFGLIKDLHDPNVSIVSGLTPTHAAPELFDGRPDRLSDLYSLAVVYQEMLTGRLPFDGKTAGELARQHLHQAPNLEPLPPADRRVVARALAKHPLDRYNSCRAFVEELRNSGTHEKYAAKARANEGDADARGQSQPDGRGESKPDARQDQRDSRDEHGNDNRNDGRYDGSGYDSSKGTSTCTSPALLGGLAVMPPLPTADSAEGWQAPLCMYIGLGGIGCSVLTRLRNLLDQKVDNRRRSADHQWLAIDTDFDLLSEVCNTRLPGNIDYRNVCHLKLFRPQDYRERADDRFNAISRRWLYNIPRTQKTEGVRPLAMLTLVDHLVDVQHRIYDQLKKLLASRQSLEGLEAQPIRVYLCGSLHGGTGSAIMADVGRIVRRILAQLNCHDYFLMATASIATTTGGQSCLPAAAALATLCEIDAQMESGNFIPPVGPQNSFKSGSSRPFDWLTLVDGGIHGNADDAENTIEDLTESLWVDSHTLVGPTLDAARHAQSSHHSAKPRSWLRAARSSLVQLGNDLQPAQVARVCCAQAIARWHACVTSGLNLQGNLENTSQAVGWSQNQTAAIVEHLSAECLRLLKLTTDTEAGPGDANVGPNPFRNRISQSSETTRLQLERDLRTCREWLAGHMRPSYISWKLLQRIMLRTVERMLELSTGPESELRKMADEDTPEREALAPADAGALRYYIKQLSDRFMQQLQQSQPQIEQFAGTLVNWSGSLQAEQKMRGASESITLEQSHVPVGWRHMLQRVHSTLDTTLQRYVVGRCFNSFAGDKSGQDVASGMLSLEHLLRLSTDMVSRLMREAGIAPVVASVDLSSSTRSIVLQDVESLVPPAALRGGRLYRLLGVTASQLSDIRPRLEQLDMVEACTIVPAQFGEEPVAVCDANELNLPALISAFWRPNADVFKLAERLHTRCDVAWPSIDNLLSSEVSV